MFWPRQSSGSTGIQTDDRPPHQENGFYYDFADLTISDTDFEKIESEMQKIVAENYISKRETFSSKEEALKQLPTG